MGSHSFIGRLIEISVDFGEPAAHAAHAASTFSGYTYLNPVLIELEAPFQKRCAVIEAVLTAQAMPKAGSVRCRHCKHGRPKFLPVNLA
jgi:hypothetical protein